jgi:hypothetical protein
MRAAVWASALLLFLMPEMVAAQGRKGTDTTSAAQSLEFNRLLGWAAVWGNTKGEGVYTCEEWKRYATRLFNDADHNRDGYVDAREFEAIQKADSMMESADLAYFDDNRDGRLSRSEFVDKPNPFFARYDKKGTCRVTLDDLSGEPPAREKPGLRRPR